MSSQESRRARADSAAQAQANAYFSASHVDAPGLEAALRALSPAQRLVWIRSLGRARQRELFDACAGRAMTIADLVPPDMPPLAEVICEGRNTLPAFRLFQKRFCRPEGQAGVLHGYNHQTMAPITGPGYFVAFDDPATGEVVIDYRRLPDSKPAAWPPIIPNENRLGMFVYSGMVDRLRRVSDDVFIGRAFRGDKPMGAWFILYRDLPGLA
jgi:hypothetical protein